MSKSVLELTPVQSVACCSPLVEEPIAADRAERIAPLLKSYRDSDDLEVSMRIKQILGDLPRMEPGK